ncbi:MAG TPA: hypothetical protein VKG25_21415, partial [Bryobacteraceae bacterium]|nr:hypothetical protein [Bryobacteraceae bacterium]
MPALAILLALGVSWLLRQGDVFILQTCFAINAAKKYTPDAHERPVSLRDANVGEVAVDGDLKFVR